MKTYLKLFTITILLLFANAFAFTQQQIKPAGSKCITSKDEKSFKQPVYNQLFPQCNGDSKCIQKAIAKTKAD